MTVIIFAYNRLLLVNKKTGYNLIQVYQHSDVRIQTSAECSWHYVKLIEALDNNKKLPLVGTPGTSCTLLQFQNKSETRTRHAIISMKNIKITLFPP